MVGDIILTSGGESSIEEVVYCCGLILAIVPNPLNTKIKTIAKVSIFLICIPPLRYDF